MLILRFLYIALFFTLPVSVENLSLGFGINIPSEPIEIVIAFTLLFYWKQLYEAVKQVYTNPLFLSITGYILWSWVSCIYSDMPKVSIKYTVIETLHLIVFVAGYIFVQKKDFRFFLLCIFAYTLSFGLILLRGLYLHAQYNFVIDFSAASMRPFYHDHPFYGAVLAFLIPFWVYFFQRPEALPRFFRDKKLIAGILFLLLTGLFLSFSRAAWLTIIIGGIGALLVYCFRSQTKHLVIAFSSLVIMLAVVGLLITGVTQKKEYVKSTTVYHQLLSAFNWTYDVANLERLNRYKCAWRMFQERPLTGFGNNLYKFRYLAYQKKEEMTRISLVEALPLARLGTGGNSHSDYLAALTELGLPGFLFWCGIVFFSLLFAAKLFFQKEEILFLFIFFALTTFFMHVLVNNFIHEDKLAGIMWSCCAVILSDQQIWTLKKSN